jgi:hypothetical protein
MVPSPTFGAICDHELNRSGQRQRETMYGLSASKAAATASIWRSELVPAAVMLMCPATQAR